MNDSTAPLPPMPPLIPPVRPGASRTPAALGENPEEQVPITGLVSAFEAILRQPRRVMHQLRQPGASNVITALLIIAAVCSVVYGGVVGTFSGGVQLWAAPVKVAGGLFVSALICLPSLYIFACLNGSRVRLVEVAGLLAGLLALMTVLLVGFAPVAWVFSQSVESIAAMGALHLVFWAIACYFALRFLDSGLRHLGEQSGGGHTVWLLIFMLVLLQMTTALRPIVGTSEVFLTKEKKFFAAHWIESLQKESGAKPPATDLPR